jgi:hypothetical protein
MALIPGVQTVTARCITLVTGENPDRAELTRRTPKAGFKVQEKPAFPLKYSLLAGLQKTAKKLSEGLKYQIIFSGI